MTPECLKAAVESGYFIQPFLFVIAFVGGLVLGVLTFVFGILVGDGPSK